MSPSQASLRDRIDQAFARAFEAAGVPGDALVQRASRPDFGHYQVNGVMRAAKVAGRKPRDLAGEVLAHLDLGPLEADCEIAGPGFVNVTLRPGFLAAWLAGEGRVALEPGAALPAGARRRVVVDYSAPNLAKEMHVGHLRSTIIGDAVVRVLEHLGHEVIRQNHVGDWGTQFGMLITHLEDLGDEAGRELADLERFYQQAKKRFDADEAFADRARRAVVALQSGEPRARSLWQAFIDTSLEHAQSLYDRLDVTLRREHVMAESAYNDALPGVLEALDRAGLLEASEGAQVVFLDAFRGRDDEPLPLIVRKRDGGYLYATTDLAAARYRSETLKADRALYFVDARQSLHLAQVFAVARAAGLVREDLELEHCAFGVMLGKDKRPFRTREGGTVKLHELLDEGERRARALLAERAAAEDGRNDARPPARAHEGIVHAVSVAAIKYADLAKHRTSDYVFDWDAMLTFEGNTGPYLLYAITRLHSLFRRAGSEPDLHGPLDPREPAEIALAARLAQFGEILVQTADEACPHVLCGWLHETATAFSAFYENCPVLRAQDRVREARLALCAHTLARLRRGVGLLGLTPLERM